MSKAPRPSILGDVFSQVAPTAAAGTPAPRPAAVPADTRAAPDTRPDAIASGAATGFPRPPVEDDMFRTSLYLSRAVHDKLREIAFAERRKVHDLFMEGIDQVLKSRGFPSIAELRRDAGA